MGTVQSKRHEGYHDTRCYVFNGYNDTDETG